jgi:hypothetical protein
MARAVTPDEDYEFKTFEYDGQTYRVRSKFKIFKFFKQLSENPVTALELAVEPEDFERLMELDINIEEFGQILEAVANTLGAGSAGN